MIYLHIAGKKKILANWKEFSLTDEMYPVVTTQIAVYNECNVIERVVEACAKMEYPQGKHFIQILDDSTDETVFKIDGLIDYWTEEGCQIEVIRRQGRLGYKAGALANAHSRIQGEFVAVFDADFIPEKNFLLATVPEILKSEKVGLLQARWGHVNEKSSFLTRAQSLGIDGHFMIEQSARSWNGLYMNFNGTAGLWRVEAIEEAGGWQWDTLTEDMDLSYRAQLKGWETRYRPDIVVPAEIPESVNAFKSQQFRWAKGSIQTAMKILPGMIKEKGFSFKTGQAFLHMTHYIVHPLMLFLALLSLPVQVFVKEEVGLFYFAFIGALLVLSVAAPNCLYIVSQKMAYEKWQRRLLFLPALVVIGTGIAINNSKAVFEALFKKESGFIRTPKNGQKEIVSYHSKCSKLVLCEILLGIYCAVSLYVTLGSQHYYIGPFLLVYTIAFLSIGIMSLKHDLGKNFFKIKI